MNKTRLVGTISFLLLSLFFGYWSLGLFFGAGFSDFDLLFLVGFIINFLMIFGINHLNKFFEVIGKVSVVLNGITYTLWVFVLLFGILFGFAAARASAPWYSYPVLFILFFLLFLIYLSASVSFFVALKEEKDHIQKRENPV